MEHSGNENLIACCGLYCGSCSKYQSSKCPGCAKNDAATWCEIRKCCQKFGIKNCAECAQFANAKDCPTFYNWISRFFGYCFSSDRCACIDRIKKVGPPEFADEMSKNKIVSIPKRSWNPLDCDNKIFRNVPSHENCPCVGKCSLDSMNPQQFILKMTQPPLMVSISGVRGIAGYSTTLPQKPDPTEHSLLPSVITSFASGFACLLRKQQNPSTKIVVGRDSRVTGPWVQEVAIKALVSYGFNVISCGIVPTPTVQVMVQQLKTAGGLVITSSHNPIMWNGLKFIGSDGLFLPPSQCYSLFEIAKNVPIYSDISGKVIEKNNAYQQHVDLILELPFISAESISKRKFKICLDTVNGAGGPTMTYLLRDKLGCEVIELNTEPTGRFSHPPEPVAQHLFDLCSAVVAHKADIGIAVDPDVDRCVIIDESGTPIGEERTLVLAVYFLLQFCIFFVGKRGPICKNLSSSRAIDDVAQAFDCPVYATPVGEIMVAKRMEEVKAIIGGEGNGGVMLPDVHIGRDALVAATLLLQLLCNINKSLGKLCAELPKYEIVQLQGVEIENALEELKGEWSKKAAKLDTNDGLHISSENWWVHLRKSNTEPIIRVIGEAPTLNQATELCNEFRDFILQHKK